MNISFLVELKICNYSLVTPLFGHLCDSLYINYISPSLFPLAASIFSFLHWLLSSVLPCRRILSSLLYRSYSLLPPFKPFNLLTCFPKFFSLSTVYHSFSLILVRSILNSRNHLSSVFEIYIILYKIYII